MSYIRQNFRVDIHRVVEYLSTKFADMFADTITIKRGRTSAIGAIEHASQCPRTEEEQPSNHADDITTFFGVDVTNASCTFSSQEMSDLGPQGQAYVLRKWGSLMVTCTSKGFQNGKGCGNSCSNYGSNSKRRVAATGTVAKDKNSGITNNTRLSWVVNQEPRAPTLVPPTSSKGL